MGTLFVARGLREKPMSKTFGLTVSPLMFVTVGALALQPVCADDPPPGPGGPTTEQKLQELQDKINLLTKQGELLQKQADLNTKQNQAFLAQFPSSNYSVPNPTITAEEHAKHAGVVFQSAFAANQSAREIANKLSKSLNLQGINDADIIIAMDDDVSKLEPARTLRLQLAKIHQEYNKYIAQAGGQPGPLAAGTAFVDPASSMLYLQGATSLLKASAELANFFSPTSAVRGVSSNLTPAYD